MLYKKISVLQVPVLNDDSLVFEKTLRLNGTAIYTSKDLKERDILEIGKNKFFYFDFAREYHQW